MGGGALVVVEEAGLRHVLDVGLERDKQSAGGTRRVKQHL